MFSLQVIFFCRKEMPTFFCSFVPQKAILFESNMYTIQESINQWLIDRGVISNTASVLDNTIMLLFIILITVAIDYICRYIFLNMFKRLAKKTRNQWDDLIVERKIINKLMHIIPAVLVYVLLPLAFPQTETPKLLDLLQMVCKIYIIAVSLRFINASLNVVLEIYNRKESFKNKPLKGFIQLLQVGVYFVAVILIVSVIIEIHCWDSWPVSNCRPMICFARTTGLPWRNTVPTGVSSK